jgi:hypothetical protein
MPFFIFHWSDEIIEHLAEHGVTPDDFEAAFLNPVEITVSASSGEPAIKGFDESGRLLFCVYREISDVDIEPVTAFEI